MEFLNQKTLSGCHLFVFSVFMFLLTIHVSGQVANSLKFITIEEAVYRALAENNLIKASKFRLKKADWDVKQAWTQLFPRLSFQTRYNWIDEQTYAERDFRRYLPPELANEIPQTVFQESYFSSFDMNMPLFNGVLVNGLSIAYEQQEMSENLDRSAIQETIFRVISTYLDILKNKELVELQKQYLELSQLNYEKAERMYKANRYSQNEALRWKIDLQQQKSNVVTNESILRTGLLNLSRLLNAEINESAVFEKVIPANITNEADKIEKLEVEQILQLAEFNNDEIVKVNATLNAARSNKKISELLHRNSYANYMPNISLSYSYGWRENNTLELDDYSPKSLMVNFSVPIFTSFQNLSELKSTYYAYKINEEEFNNQLLNTKMVLNDIINRLLNLKVQQELSSSNIEFSENNYRVVEVQKEKGLASNIEYIDAKLNLQNAKLQHVTNKYDFITSMLEFYYLTGKIEQFIR